MAGRAKQMEDLNAKREDEEAQYQMEVAKLKEEWKLYLRELEAEKAATAAKQAAYRRELDCQVQYKNIRQVIQVKCRNTFYGCSKKLMEYVRSAKVFLAEVAETVLGIFWVINQYSA